MADDGFNKNGALDSESLKSIHSRLDSHAPTSVTSNNEQRPYIIKPNTAPAEKIIKTANTNFVGGSTMGNTNNISRAPLMFWDPLLDPTTFLFPKDDVREANLRYRHYGETHYLVSRALALHSQYPLSDFTLEVDDLDIFNYYNDYKDRLKMLELMQVGLWEYYCTGEGVLYGNWNMNELEWSDWLQFPMENVDVYSSFITSEQLCFLKPDQDLKDKFAQNQKVYDVLSKTVDKEYLDAVNQGQPYFLSPNRLIRLVRRSSKFQKRGWSLVRANMTSLMMEDKYNVLRLTAADRLLHPMKIFKLGDKSLGWIPPDSHFQSLRDLYANSLNDPDFAFIYHFGLEVQVINPQPPLGAIKGELEMIQKNLTIGMFADPAMLLGGTAPYANSTVSMRVLQHTYLTIRSIMEKEVIFKIFLPIAQKRNYLKRSSAELNHKIRINNKCNSDGLDMTRGIRTIASLKDKEYGIVEVNMDYGKGDTKKQLVVAQKDGNGIRIMGGQSYLERSIKGRYYVPNVIWHKLNLFNNNEMMRTMVSLFDKREIPFRVIADVFGWDYSMIEKWKKDEVGSVWDSRWSEQVDDIVKKEGRSDFLKGEPVDNIIDRILKKEEQAEKDKQKKKEKIKDQRAKEGLETLEPGLSEVESPAEALEEEGITAPPTTKAEGERKALGEELM